MNDNSGVQSQGPAVESGAHAVFGQNPPARNPRKQQSWGAVVAVIIIVFMVIVGAFYAWGKRIAEQQQIPAATGQ